MALNQSIGIPQWTTCFPADISRLFACVGFSSREDINICSKSQETKDSWNSPVTTTVSMFVHVSWTEIGHPRRPLVPVTECRRSPRLVNSPKSPIVPAICTNPYNYRAGGTLQCPGLFQLPFAWTAMSLFILSLTLFAATTLALDATDANATASKTSPSTMLIGVLAAIAMVFIFIAAALVLFLRSWDSMLCCKRRRQGQAAKTASRRRHVGGVAVELGEPRYPPPAYQGYEKTGAMV
ncbi:hypothetical protein EDD85DRAFT_852617 [Armillaria nabsnona]|nr:hypothetical protein EDD85DRAFT_852617 [Armillaria nabsnona]